MSYKKIKPEQYVMVCSHAWRDRTLQDIIENEKIVDFNSQDQMTFKYLQKYKFDNYIHHSRYYANSTVNIAQLVCSGLGYSILVKEFAKPYIKDQQLCILNDGKSLEIQSYLAWYDRPQPPKYFQEMIEAIN